MMTQFSKIDVTTIANTYKEALEGFYDDTVYFKDRKQENIISLTPVAMDGSLEYYVFPLEKDGIGDYIKRGWLEPYLGDDVDEEETHFANEIEKLLTEIDIMSCN